MTPVEQVQALWSAFASGGAVATLAQVPDDCEWVPSPDLRAPGPLRGREMRAYLEQLEEAGVRLEPTLHTCEPVGEHVLAGRLRIVSPSVLSDSPHFWLYRMQEGRVTRVETYASRRAALDAAGTPAL